ncbi:hypothetical protein [Acinetobacter ihumii]|uniref:hypothetical protein n=1 Tax=Acinetobacter ihumii TaxID=2483802 RepID=UPI00102FA2B5|nr:hypothetical protein [Acinetobacter ihumii]
MKQDFTTWLKNKLRGFNLPQLCAVLVIGNALYFSYSFYLEQHNLSGINASQPDQNNQIQLTK